MLNSTPAAPAVSEPGAEAAPAPDDAAAAAAAALLARRRLRCICRRRRAAAAAAVASVRMLERLAAIRSPDIAAEPVLPEIEKIASEVKNTLDALLRESEPK
jgi:hypothetical protein